MGKGQYRDRGRRRRGFDDDHFSPQDARDVRDSKSYDSPSWQSPAPSASPSAAMAGAGPSQDARVKMFNEEKGFGFVELADGSGDAFLHIGVLQAAGYDCPTPGTTLKVQAGQGPKGQQVTAVLSVDASTASAERPRSAAGAPRRGRPDPASAVEMEGTVKWFNPDKGFGFVQVADGGKDVFLHISVVEASGLTSLPDGQPVSMRVVEGQKGREAISVTPL